jgi:DNA-binding NarL/FixJ family response regulator
MFNRNVLKIVLADNHSLIRHGIKKLIEKNSELEVVGEVGDGEELLCFLEDHSVDLIVLDISMPGIGGMEAAASVKKKYPWIKILMLTMHTSQQIFYNAMIAGADGYLLKDDSDEELLVAIDRVKSGKNYISPRLADDFTDDVIEMYRNGKKSPFRELTKREKEILQLVVNGYTSKKMAEHLGLSPRTIDHHRSNLLKKLNKRNSADLVNYAVRNGYVSS